jgi:hypothetical protein
MKNLIPFLLVLLLLGCHKDIPVTTPEGCTITSETRIDPGKSTIYTWLNGRLLEVDDNDSLLQRSTKEVYEYDHGRLSAIKHYDPSLSLTRMFSYTADQITEKMIIGSDTARIIYTLSQGHVVKEHYVGPPFENEYTLNWENGNITSINVNENGYNFSYKYEYDNHPNPHARLSYPFDATQNNRVKVTGYDGSGNFLYSTQYKYQYDDKGNPILCTSSLTKTYYTYICK